ncbi:helix-turn-helix transcriptional regulator [Collinsella sp. An307]|uniref:helix-turn-helix domain-containing protein n=1 Tax=Collinsella sp. An307 TaxID=1965630 RepID=UPI000B395B67|nr:helix-turn-helix transcriptional regulator [Collinsella sp. An307]OUO19757.1 hypothetical protein B5F89_06835 [Collinsella sp. An307]
MARFGDMLYQRRREMGLTILQVANTIKIRPQIIEFFENGDFSSMPPRGYAQGMISSYARYLGLNPREVVEAYFDDLRAYEQATDNHGGRFQDAAGLVSTRSASATGRFMMVDSAPRSRYAQRPPQAGYVSEHESGHEPERARNPYARRSPSSQVTQRIPVFDGQNDVAAPRAPRSSAGYERRSGVRGSAAARNRGYASQGAYDGRRMSGPSSERRASGRGVPPRRGRASSGRPSPSGPSFDNRLLLGLIAAILVAIALMAVLLVRGCAPAETDDKAGSSAVTAETVAQTPEENEDTDSTDANDTDEDGDASDDADPATDPEAQTPEEPQQLVVKISVAEGDSSWLEVRVDGSIVLGDEVVGPFEQEFIPQSNIRITANTPGSVKVAENGKEVRWDTSTSGVARINLTAPETPAAPATTEGETGDATQENTDATGDDSAAATQ